MFISILSKEFCDYSYFLRGVTRATLKRYKNTIDYFQRETGTTKLGEVTKDVVEQFFINGRKNKNWSTNTYHVYLKSLSVFFDWCVERKYLETNPAAGIPRPKIETRLPKHLNTREVRRILDSVKNYPYDSEFIRRRNQAILGLFIYSGLRKNELLGLQLKDVSVEGLSIYVREGKGRKERMLPIHPQVAHALQYYLEERKTAKKTCPEFFTSANRNTGYTDSGLKRMLQEIQKASGIYFTAHMLRHTFAMIMLESGCDIFSLSKLMGHNDINTTCVYLDLNLENTKNKFYPFIEG